MVEIAGSHRVSAHGLSDPQCVHTAGALGRRGRRYLALRGTAGHSGVWVAHNCGYEYCLKMCVCVCPRMCVPSSRSLGLCQPVPLIFLGAADLVLGKPDPALSAFFTAVPGRQSPQEWPQFPSSSQGRPWCKRPHTLWLSHNIGTGTHTGTHTSTQTDIQERISSEALDVLFKCSNRNEHKTPRLQFQLSSITFPTV